MSDQIFDFTETVSAGNYNKSDNADGVDSNDLSFRGAIPQDVYSTIFSHLSLKELARCYQVSKDWSMAVKLINDICIFSDVPIPTKCVARPSFDGSFDRKLSFAASRLKHLTSIDVRLRGMFSRFLDYSTTARISMRDLLSSNSRHIRKFTFLAMGNDVSAIMLPLSFSTKLETLKLEGCGFWRPRNLKRILENKQVLKELRLWFMEFEMYDHDQSGALDLALNFSLEIHDLYVQISALHNLQELDLDNQYHTDFSTEHLPKMFAGLNLLRKIRIKKLNDESILAISTHCPHLEELSLKCCFGNDISLTCVLELLRKCPIISLSIPGVKGTGSGDMHIIDLCMASKTLVNLEVSSDLWNRDNDPQVNFFELPMAKRLCAERQMFMEEAAFKASGGRVKLTFLS